MTPSAILCVCEWPSLTDWRQSKQLHFYQYMLHANSITNPVQNNKTTTSVLNSESLEF